MAASSEMFKGTPCLQLLRSEWKKLDEHDSLSVKHLGSERPQANLHMPYATKCTLQSLVDVGQLDPCSFLRPYAGEGL